MLWMHVCTSIINTFECARVGCLPKNEIDCRTRSNVNARFLVRWVLWMFDCLYAECTRECCRMRNESYHPRRSSRLFLFLYILAWRGDGCWRWAVPPRFALNQDSHYSRTLAQYSIPGVSNIPPNYYNIAKYSNQKFTLSEKLEIILSKVKFTSFFAFLFSRFLFGSSCGSIVNQRPVDKSPTPP